MLIRSQDKMSLVKFENIVVNINNINGKEIICWSQMNPGEDEYISLGYYSTKAKAMKVLDMIQEVYADAKLNEILLPDVCKSANESQRGKDNTLIAKTIRKDFMKKMIFQMPEDSEVEV